MTRNRVSILLAAQNALLGEVFPALEAVDISWETNEIELRFFLSTAPTDEDVDSMSAIEGEMYAYFPDETISYSFDVGKTSLFQRGEACIFARRPDYNSPE